MLHYNWCLKCNSYQHGTTTTGGFICDKCNHSEFGGDTHYYYNETADLKDMNRKVNE